MVGVHCICSLWYSDETSWLQAGFNNFASLFWCFSFFCAIPGLFLSGDLSDESSQRLVVFYIPRRVFQLNRCNHIGALFRSGDPGVQVEMCGIRLVYEQHVEEFVQTLVEYMLGSPDANHQSFSEHLSHQRRILQGCNHEKHYLCPFLPERRPNPMPMVLPNNETIQEECTSRETFSSQVIAAGLKCWLKPNLQDHHKSISSFNCCFLQSEIPKRFTKQNNSHSVGIPLLSNLYNRPEWIGFAVSSIFSFQKNLTTASMKQGSGFSHMVICHLKTNLGCMNPLLYYRIREEDVLASIYQCEFCWESIIQRRLLSPEWSKCTWVEFSFISDTLDVSALKCGVELVFQHNLEEFTLAQCITSYNGPSTSNEILPFTGHDKFSDSDSHEDQTNGTSSQYSYEGTHTRCQLYQTAAKDFHPSSSYNCCFPPSKFQDWFSHQNHGHSVTMDLPSNLYHDSNCMGLVLYASFSIHGDPNFILSHLNSGKSHSLYCQCQMSMTNVDDQTIAFSTSKEEITWLLELGEFIWISYVPGEPFKNMLQHCNHIKASFVSDWPGVIVQKCALQLLYHQEDDKNHNKCKSEAQQQIYSSKLPQTLSQVHVSPPPLSAMAMATATQRDRAVREAVDRVLAMATKGKRRWSYAFLTNRRRRKFQKKHRKQQRVVSATGTSRSPKKHKVSVLRLKGKSLLAVKSKVRVLGRVVPGCRKQPLPVIIEEATDYIAALEMQVRAMTTLANLLSGSSSSSASSSSAPPPPS